MSSVTAGEVLGIKAPSSGETVRLPVMMLDTDGNRLTSQAWDASGMTVKYAKEGDSSFSDFPTFGTDNWDEIGYGLYEVIIRQSDADELALLDTEGHFKLYVKNSASRGDVFLFKVNPDDVVREDKWTDDLADHLDALYVGAFTVASVSSPLSNPDRTYITADENAEGANQWTDAWAIFTSGDAAGIGRWIWKVSWSDKDPAAKFSLAPSIPDEVIPSVGDTFIVMNLGGVRSAEDIIKTDTLRRAFTVGVIPVPTYITHIQEGEEVWRWQCALQAVDGGAISDITAGDHDLYRIRGGVRTAIAYGVPNEKASNNVIQAEVDLSENGWQAGDIIQIEPNEMACAVGGQTYQVLYNHGATKHITFSCWIVPDTVSPGAGVGDNTVTFTVKDQGGTPLQGANVAVRASAGGANIRPGLTTNASGQVSACLDDGTYYVQASLNGYTHSEETAAVDEDPEAVSITMTAITISSPAEANQCRVYTYPRDIGGEVDTDDSRPLFTVRLAHRAKTSDGVIIDTKEIDATQHASGYWYCDLVVLDDLTATQTGTTLTYIFKLRDGGTWRRRVNSADGATVNLVDLDE